MTSKQAVANIREALKAYVGHEITVDANVGRKRIIGYQGYLESTYPNLFVVCVGDGDTERKLSFNYVDLYTGTVVIGFVKEGKKVDLMHVIQAK